jgi:hypothetical protein
LPNLTPAGARRQIANGALDPVYLVVGEDETEKLSLVSAFADSIEADLRPFNVERLRAGERSPGRETTAATVVDALRTLPMLAPRRIVVVAEAEKLLAPKRGDEVNGADKGSAVRSQGRGGRSGTPGEQELLEAYVRAPEPHATLLLDAGQLD